MNDMVVRSQTGSAWSPTGKGLYLRFHPTNVGYIQSIDRSASGELIIL